MTALIRLTLELTAPLGTPLAGPTLFGQLCWLKREALGEAALVRWLREPHAFWRISDGFPHGYLPKPLVRPRPVAARELMSLKTIKKQPYVSRNAWLAKRAGWDETRLDADADLAADTARMGRTAHNVIDRRTGGTLEAGGLFFLDEDWRFASKDSRKVDLYVEASGAPEAAREAFTELGEVGFGRDASTGRGRWRVVAAAEDAELAAPAGERRMSLSRGFLSPDTMTEALWRLEPHFGRAGPQVTATGASPFKRPVLLTRPGMTFRPSGDGPFGRWLADVHPGRPEIGLNGFHVTIPFTEASH